MRIELDSLSGRDVYQLMIQTIVPRPVAWVLTDNGDGSLNLAPFSYFNGVTSRPPTLSLSIGRKRDGSRKDTWRNIEERGHFVVHIARTAQAPAVSATSASLEHGESEVEANRLEVVEESGWPLPRLRHAPVALYCHRHRIIEIGDGPQGLVIGEIKSAWYADDVATPSDSGPPRIDARKLDPLARLGGDDYGALGNTFTVPRPA